MSKKLYYAAVDGFILGSYRKKDEPCGELTERQARYPLLSGLITITKPKVTEPLKREEPSPAALDKKTR